MIRQINLNNNLANLKELMSSYIRTNPDDPNDGMFYDVKDCTATINSVEYTGVRATVMVGETEKPAVEFYKLSNGGLYVNAYYNVEASTPSSLNRTYYTANGANRLVFSYATDNGFMLYWQLTERSTNAEPAWLTIMVTKGNDGIPFVVLSSLSSNSESAHLDSVAICHANDISYLIPSMLTMQDAQYQNALCPIMGYGAQMSVTYAPYGFWFQQAQESVRGLGFSIIRFNGEIDGITNGYWTILDGQREDAS